MEGDEAASFEEPGRVEGREGYRSLLVGSRDMRREHAVAREAWFASLQVARKGDLLFELEVLLKGLACFANPRNHAGPPRRVPVIAVDFKPALRIAREGMVRVLSLVRILLEEQEQRFVFQRYLEHAVPEDSARSRFIRAASRQETPEESLVALRHAMTHLVELADALLTKERVPYRTFNSVLVLFQREVARNSFFNPLRALEFRPEFDRIRNPQVFQLVQSVQGEEAHRLVALCFLSFYRMLRYLSLADLLVEGGHAQRAFVVHATLRSDARALVAYLRNHSGRLLAGSYEGELFTGAARTLHQRYESLLAEGHRLLGLKGALDGIAARLAIEVRRTFERDLPAVDEDLRPAELHKRMLAATEGLRPAIQSVILFLCRALDARLDAHFVFDDHAATRAVGERLRRDVWMFAQIVRGFAAKAAVVKPGKSDRWESVESFRFVQEFLHYFRAMGYPLLRSNDYPRVDDFIAAMSSLEETDLLDPPRIQTAIRECESFHRFLMELFESISLREELAGTPFDRRGAAEALRLYLGA